ncbi:hypothetical protein [Streptomyces nigrescens]|uniref:Uncharacterized protein n=1 Tax=Streptomyces nigrescens TaxID=1920 RepID=A0A640T8S2_STRNI|nr:hypothetical protein [Streptomyces libani]WAT94981.1 hypothetical protein STRLI_000654 [Streptomyces libani subsp. libani]GFE20139.1 hypothetical protein Sliba_05920 [Streptomyces libani subsp. libani]GGV85971.1 hypothetical protein GCM10010500_03360 [Streptomyces libani subsp. libani]
MPETGYTQLQLFPDTAVAGSGRRLCAAWPIDRPTLTEVLATDEPTTPQADQLPLDSDEMRSAA